MKTLLNPEDRKTFDEEVIRVLKHIGTLDPASEEYQNSVKNLNVLCEARGVKTAQLISTDVVVAALTNILGIGLILYHERVNVITTKAIGFVFRGGRG